MIEVRVGEQDLVDVSDAFAKQLMAGVGRCVDDQGGPAALSVGGSPDHDAAIPTCHGGVLARLGACGAVAEEGGHAAACGRSHERELVRLAFRGLSIHEIGLLRFLVIVGCQYSGAVASPRPSSRRQALVFSL